MVSEASRETEAYRVVADSDGCPHCHAGKTWTVVGPDDVAIGQSFSEEVDAEETAEMLNHAYMLGVAADEVADVE